jgi:SAM-dependent methyltransferase
MSNTSGIPNVFPATAMPDPDWWQALWPDPRQVLVAIGVQPHMVVVDLCCGDGLFTAPLAFMARRVIGVDIDPHTLTLARTKIAAVGAASCDLIEGDAYVADALVTEAVDFVLIANTFHGVPDKMRLARGVAAMLKPGGTFAVVNWHRLPREQTIVLGQPRGPKTNMRMEPWDVAAAVEPAGLKSVRVVELPPYHYAGVFESPKT